MNAAFSLQVTEQRGEEQGADTDQTGKAHLTAAHCTSSEAALQVPRGEVGFGLPFKCLCWGCEAHETEFAKFFLVWFLVGEESFFFRLYKT